MTRAELTAFFPALWQVPCHTGAVSYAVPTVAWLSGPCYAAFRARYWAANLDKWAVRWECRDFARAFACFAQECWALTPGAPTADDGLAVGELWYLPNPDNAATGHAVCPAITDLGLIFIEPQTGLPCKITSEQLSSRLFVRF